MRRKYTLLFQQFTTTALFFLTFSVFLLTRKQHKGGRHPYTPAKITPKPMYLYILYNKIHYFCVKVQGTMFFCITL